MGKLMHNTQIIKHSTHLHPLQLISSNLHLQNPINCSVCNLHISDHHIYTCTPCNFFLHPSCANLNDLITHPSHPHHTLSLLPTPHAGFFRCAACTQQELHRFSYHCQLCDFDLHLLCASKPLSVTHPTHPHPLLLTFSSPYGQNIGFSCDLCRGVGSSDQWLYRCVSCEFDVHLHCATAKTSPPPPPPPPLPLQHHHSSFPNQLIAQPLMRSMSAGHVDQRYWQPPQTAAPVGVQSYRLPAQPPAALVGAQSYRGLPPQPPAPVGIQSYGLPPQPALPTRNIGLVGGLGSAMVTRFVEGTMQQLGQEFVQDLGGGDMVLEIIQQVAEPILDNFF